MMTPSPACLSLIRRYETLQNKSYWDPLGMCWTIGYGHTGRDVTGGMLWTDDECEAALESDAQKAATQLAAVVDVPLTQGEIDALTDFVFNEGIGHLKESTLLRLLNNGNYAGAAAEFLKWEYAGGKPNDDLEQRRIAEQNMFLTA